MTELSTLLEQTALLHHHLCPRQVLGVRMGMHAATLLNLELPQVDKRLFTFVETDGCFADGLAVSTGCWLGHRTLRLMDYGKVAATFVDSETEITIRIYPKQSSRTAALQWACDAQSRWHAMLQAYQELPVEELFSWTPVRLSVDLKAIISQPGARVNCSVCGEEIFNQRERIVDGKPVCRACSGETYYRPQLEAQVIYNEHGHN
jgi:formylmethanofuran dehydrogenase subunit E